MTSDAPGGLLASRDQLLLEEYKNAAQLTYHVDGLRDRVTTFFLTVVGLAAAGFSLGLKDDASPLAIDLVSVLLLLVALLGLVMTTIVARLRAVQIEHFRILSNIRQYYIGKDLELWNTVELAPSTVPRPSRSSGSYMWFVAIMLVAALGAGAGTYVLLHEANAWLRNSYSIAVAVGAAVAWAVVLDVVYLRRARPREAPRYTSPPIVPLEPASAGSAGTHASAPAVTSPAHGSDVGGRRTAVVGVAVAGAISVTVGEGEWGPLAIPLGVSLFLVLLAYDDRVRSGWAERLAFAAAYGLAAMITIAGAVTPEPGEWHEVAYWGTASLLALVVARLIEERRSGGG